MNSNYKPRPRLVKTPLHGITLGEAVVSDDGIHYGLRVKKPQTDLYEDIWLDQIYGMVITASQPGNE